MKKLLGIGLTIVLIMCNCLVAFAASGSQTFGDISGAINQSQEIDVTGTLSGTVEKIYKVDVAWEAMNFTYTKGTEKWDTTEHKYVAIGGSEGTWSKTDNKITITNHSNAGINVGLGFTPTNVSGSFNSNRDGTGTTITSLSVDSAVVGTAKIGEVYLVLSGTPSTAWMNNTSLSLGTITVSIKN